MRSSDQDYLWVTQSHSNRPLAYWLLLASFLPVMVGSIAFVLHSWFGSTATAHIPAPEPVRAIAAPEPGISLRERMEMLKAKVEADNETPVPAPSLAISRDDTPADWNEMPIESGDTLAIAFERSGLLYDDSLSIIRLPEYGWRFTRGLRAGTTLKFQADARGHVTALDYPLDKLRTIRVRHDGDKYTAEMHELEVERRLAYGVAEIRNSFYADGLAAGLSDNVIMNLAGIYAWDIDFAKDILPGDRFTVVYEELHRNGRKIKDGNILAAEFVNRGRRYQAIRFENSDGEASYFTPEGKPLKKAFLRTPLDQFRISSHFSLGRRHPVLNRIRKHAGTDYAAPTGTPIKAAGAGRITHRGRRGGYGNLVEIQHGKAITTRYGHLSRFARGVSVGSKVRQGQIIGYVGQTGLATGPHLHYEFRQHGQPKNPVTVRLPSGPELGKEDKTAFERRSKDLLAQVDALNRVHLAYAEPANLLSR